MMQSTARVRTAKTSGYLQQMCKHFEHKLPVTLTPLAGKIAFSAGTCRLTAADGILTLRAQTANTEHLAQVESVVARHLERCAFRETLSATWTVEGAEEAHRALRS